MLSHSSHSNIYENPKSISVLFLVAVGAMAMTACADAGSLEPDHAISRIESNERRVQHLRFTCEHRTGKPNTEREFLKFSEEDFGRISTTCELDLARDRYSVHFKSAQKAERVDKANKLARGVCFSEQGFSNDSIIWRSWKRTDPTPRLVKLANDWSDGLLPEGIQCRSHEATSLNNGNNLYYQYAGRIGIGHATPYFYAPGQQVIRFSTFLRTQNQNPNFSVEFNEVDSNRWMVWVGTHTGAMNSAGYLFDYDPAAGRVNSIELGPRENVGSSQQLPIWRISMKYTAAADVIPKDVFFASYGQSEIAASWSYDDIKVNSMSSTSEFQTVFPSGIEVTDYLDEKIYMSGSDRNADLESKKFTARMKRQSSNLFD